MKDKTLHIKKPKQFEAIKMNQSPIMKMIDPTLKKYLDTTLCRFTTKCSLLVNQIEEMKREFTAQIEGISEFFPNPVSKVPLPIVSPVRKPRPKASDKVKPLIEVNNSQELAQAQGLSPGKCYLSTNPNPTGRKSEREATFTKFNLNQEPLLEKKVSIFIKDSNEEDMQLKINLTSEKPIKKKPQFSSQNAPNSFSSTTRALICLSNSDLLTFAEKIKLKSLNQALHKETQTSNIFSTSKQFLNEKLAALLSKKSDNLPSQTSQSSLNFIKKENENDLKDMSNRYNRAFYELVYILSGEAIPSNISYEHLYESVLRKNQAQSIKHLFLSVLLKKLVESPLDYSNEIIEKFNSVIQSNKELISQNALLNESKSLSLFTFCLKEFYHFFQYEMTRRREIQRLKLLINELNDWMKARNFS